MKRRLLATILCLCMLTGLLPVTALASGETEPLGGTSTETLYVYPGEKFTVALSKEMGNSITISGYNEAEDWYVTDGLALHYDGIYNAGMGEKHDGDASEWIQLVEDAGGDLTISGQTWGSSGLKVEDTAVGKSDLSPAITTGAEGMTVEQIFSIVNAESAMGTKGDYFYPLQVGYISFGNVRMDGPVLNYANKNNTVLNNGAIVNEALVTMTLTSDGTQTRAVYRNGGARKSQTLKQPIEDHYSFGSVDIPVNEIKAADWTKEEPTKVTLEKTIYGLRIYDRELTADEVAQNAALDQARFEDDTYVTPGTVDSEPLLEYDYSKNEQSTTVTVSGNSVELSLNELTDRRTLTFTDGITTITQDVVVMSKDDAEKADDVINKINALPDAGSVTAENEAAISAASAAYELLNSQQKGRVGGERKDKLDACVAALDEQLAGNKTYELTYDLNDDDGVQAALPEGTPDTATVIYKGDPFTLAVPTRANYTFLGWWYGNTQITDGSGASLEAWTILSGGEITAHWERTEDLGTERNPYPISSAEQWYALARILKSRPASDGAVSGELKQDYAGFGYTGGYAAAYDALQTTYYQLQNSITLTPQEGYFGVPNFKGTLDGKNHVVTLNYNNLNVSVTSSTQFGGLIQSSEHCVVKNLTLDGTISGQYTATAGLQDIGVLIGTTKTTKDPDPTMEIENVTSNVTVDLTIDVNGSATSYLGAMIGRAYAPAAGYQTKLKNCTNNGAITVTYLNASSNTGRVGGLIGHAYSAAMDGCKNYGDLTHKGDTAFSIGGMAGSASAEYRNCIQGGSIESPISAVVPFPGMNESQEAGNLLEIKVSGTPGTSVTYVGGDTRQIGEDGTVTFQIPIYRENDAVENNAFSYNNYFTVNGVRLDFFSLTSRKFSAVIQTGDAEDLRLPFQSENDALVITTAEQMLALQKAINDGDKQSINTIFASRGMNAESVGYEEARLALQSGYYKLGDNIELKNSKYTGIGTKAFPFGGHFNGGGHTITLTLSGNIEAQYVGVFGYVDSVGGSQPEINSLNIVSEIELDYDARNNTTYFIGSLAGAFGGSVATHGLSDVTVQVNKIKVTTSHNDSNYDTYYVGGVAGYGRVSNVDVKVTGSIAAGGKGLFYTAGVTGAGSVQQSSVMFQENGSEISVNSSATTGSAAAVLSAYTSGDMTFADVTIENQATEAVKICAEGEKPQYAGGIVGYMPTATSNQVSWLRVDDTVQVIGKFEVSAGDNGYAGGLVGRLFAGYSAEINGFVNTMDVSSRFAGGLFGDASPSGELQTLTITDSLNVGKITGTGNTPKAGALMGILSIHTEPSFRGNAYLASSCNQVIGQVANTGADVEDSEVAAKLDLSVLEGGAHSYMGTVQLVAEKAPTALTLAPAEYFCLQNDGKLQFVKVGTSAAEFLWNGRLFYTSNPITVSAKKLTQDDVTITGISSSYPSDEAAQDALTSIEVVYEGHTLVEGTDYTVTHQKDNDTFTITFTGNFTGTVNKSYDVDLAAPIVTVEDHIGIYDAAAHSISVSAPEGATVTYGENPSSMSDTNPSYTAVGTHVVYWKVKSNGHSVTGSAVVEITPAHLTIKAHDKSAYVGDAVPVLGEDDYTVTGLVSDETLDTKPTLSYTSTPNMSIAGTYQIKASGADAGTNYTISYVDGTLTVSRRSSGGGGGGSSSSGDYIVSVDKTTHGKVTVSPSRADKGDTVTIAVKPNKGYELDELIVTAKNGDKIKLTEKADNKFTFKMPGSKVTVEASFKLIETTPEVLVFVDVPVDAYYADAVEWAVKEGITSGTSATTFSPNASCTRAQMVTFLWRANGAPKATSTNPFTDVSADAYYYDAVLWAAEKGITSGTTATTFSPDAVLTRGQTVTFLWRANGSPAVSSSRFGDVAADAYYAKAVAWAVSEGITAGTGVNKFSPDAPCTRAQIVTFLYRDAH